MQVLESFFGVLFLIGIVACGLVWMFSAHHGMGIAKGIGLSVLMFIAGRVLVPMPGTNLFVGVVEILLAFTLMLVAIIGPVGSHATTSLVRIVAAVGGAALVLLVGVNQLCATWSGRILLIIVGFSLVVILQMRSAGHE
ncbi:MAG TPA: hypothetical protein VNX18_05345 [Bryobacteraceae bacterium]|jgi:hypothetical protein|nr:hypothetical protein [Bryobacteraceae bacterium]